MDLDHWPANNDTAVIFLVVIVTPTFMNVGAASMLFCLSGRKAAVSPSGFPALTPSRGTVVAVTVGTSFISALAAPALIVIVLVMPSAVPLSSALRRGCWCEQSERSNQREYYEPVSAHVRVSYLECNV